MTASAAKPAPLPARGHAFLPAPPSPGRAPVFDQLERLGAAVERRAVDHGLDLEFLGIEPIFDRPRLYGEGRPPWIVCRAAIDPMVSTGLPIPAANRRHLSRLVEYGMDFPHLFLAHELPGPRRESGAKPDFGSYRTLTDTETASLLVRPAAPAATQRTARRLDCAARAVGRGLGRAASGMAMAVAAPIALLADGLDPAVLGVLTLPRAGHAPGTPAAWFLLTRWDW